MYSFTNLMLCYSPALPFSLFLSFSPCVNLCVAGPLVVCLAGGLADYIVSIEISELRKIMRTCTALYTDFLGRFSHRQIQFEDKFFVTPHLICHKHPLSIHFTPFLCMYKIVISHLELSIFTSLIAAHCC